MEFAPQLLHAAADAQDRSSLLGVGRELLPQAAALQCAEVPQGLLAARHHDRVGAAELLARGNPVELDRGLGLEGIEVGEVAQGGELEHGDVELGSAFAAAALEQIQGVLRREEFIQPGHHPEDGDAGVGLEPAAALIEELAAAAEAVDQ